MRNLLTCLFFGLIATMAGPASANCGDQGFDQFMSDAQQAQLAEATTNTAYGQGVLWQATRGDDVIYVVGTMHIYDSRLEPLMDRVRPLLVGADLVMVEMTPDEEADMGRALLSQSDLFFRPPGSPTLPELLPEEDWQALAEAAEARGLPRFMAAKMQPWYLGMSLSIPPCALTEMIAGRRGLDHMIMADVTALGGQLQTLESWESIVEIMTEDDLDTQIEYLQLGLPPAEMSAAMMVSTLDLYFAEDIAQIWELGRIAAQVMPNLPADQGAALYADVEHDLLVRRNLAWMPVIEAAARAHDHIVVAAGAAHMPGETGLLRLLEQDGWQISSLN